MRRSALVLVVALTVASLPAFGAGADSGFAHECAPPPASGEPIDVVIGEVTCQRLHSELVGGVTAFGYYVPPGCADGGCPVLYLLHGTGGTFRSMIGTASDPHRFVRALTAGPPVDTRTHPEPWRFHDPDTWVPRPALDLIVVTPHNMTVPGGHGPEPGIDGLWSDWNPRYAQGGDNELYATPPPRFTSHVVEELVPFVESHLGAASGRESRALNGFSQGGFGAFKLGLQHPDLFSGIGSVSGGSVPGGHVAMLPDAPVDITGVPGVPHVRLPGIVPMLGGSTGESFTTAIVGGMFLGWGDPVADATAWRAASTSALATNARAFSDTGQALHITHANNDAIPRRVEDLQGSSYHYEQAYEVATLAGGLDVVRAMDAAGVEQHHEINPGLHSTVYYGPHVRRFLEDQYDHLRHRDGGGTPPPRPTVFDYRTDRRDFGIWGWRFAVDREPEEFLNLRAVSCRSLTLQGSGQVTVVVPASCRTGLHGDRTFTVDLGHPLPVDEAGGGTTQLPGYGRTTTVPLDPLGTCPPRNPRCGQETN